MEYETAGDPMTGLLWTRKTRESISRELKKSGIDVSPTIVGEILKDLNYSLKCNVKKVANGGRKLSDDEKKAIDDQFDYIEKTRQRFIERGFPVLSCDTKKKELIGNFKNLGTRYRKEADLVNDHDFITYAIGRAIPYGLYDVVRNEGFVYVFQALWDDKKKRFTSTETPELAVDAIRHWWNDFGFRRYPRCPEMLLLVDAGGSNGCRPRMWKLKLYLDIAINLGITVTVCHYPPGKSKWNPIEHRLFSEISKNWFGTPLRSFETVVKYIRSTTTKSGLKTKARLVRKLYSAGVSVPDKDFNCINIMPHDNNPNWNYTIASNA
jgi:hypothetical protein